MKKNIKKNLPEVKKTITAFLVGEEGKISKQSIIKAGVVLGAVSLSTLNIVSAHSDSISHTNNLGSLTYDNSAAAISHSQHASHSSVPTPPAAAPSSGSGSDSGTATTTPTTGYAVLNSEFI